MGGVGYPARPHQIMHWAVYISVRSSSDQFGLRYDTQKEKAVELADRDKVKNKGYGVTQLVKCLPSVQEALGFIHPQKHTKPACYTPVILASERWKQGIRVSRLSLATE